jgi:serine/threonine-protein kinase
MATCPKCSNDSPPDAVFCGYCGSAIPKEEEAPQATAKTVFGYTFDRSQSDAPDGKAPTSQQTPAKSPAAEKAPAKASASPAPASAPAPAGTTESFASQPAVSPLIAGKYELKGSPKQFPAGELFEATDTRQGVDFHLLLVKKDVFQSPLDMERSRRELRQLQKVDCPSIVKVVEHGKLPDERLFVVMERTVGNPLDELVGQSPLDLAETQRVVKGVGTALAEAQKLGVIHRDIAPHNVLICTDSSIKLQGFGIAAPIKRHVFGTPAFISPEQSSGRPVDQRSNIYSLGALMFYMLTGEPPFLGGSVDEVIEKHQKEEPVSPRARKPDLAISRKAEALVLKALAKSSSRRHLTLRQFLREVDGLDTAPPKAAPPTEDPRALSFETPLHGVTSLSPGMDPDATTEPFSKAKKTDRQPNLAGLQATLSDEVPEEKSAAALAEAAAAGKPAPAKEMELPGGAARTLIDPGAQEAAMRASAPAVAPAPEPAPKPAPAPAARKSQITGEVSSGIALKKPEAVPEEELKRRKEAIETKMKMAAQQKDQQQAPAGSLQKPAFRETMWFYKGEVESAMAAEGSEEAAKPEGEEASPEDLASKYADDGSMDEEEARRLSLRTGKTQMMQQQARVPKGTLPGERMADEDFIADMHRGRRIATWVGIFIVLLGIGALVAYLIVS